MGRTEEAVRYYCSEIDAELTYLVRFRDAEGQPEMPEAMADKIFHATFQIGGTAVMASDVGYEVGCDGPDFAGFSLAYRVKDAELAQRYFSALEKEGHVIMPLSETPFASRYGVVVDRFGVSWKIIAE